MGFVPTGSTTTGSVYGMGNMATFKANTGYTYMPIAMGRHRSQMKVVMFNEGDAGYENALDARTILGPEWQKVVAEGVNTCS